MELARLRMNGIIEGTNIGTWEWNIETGETIFNSKWAQMIGYTLDELAPISIRTWKALAHPDDLEKSEALLNQHFSGKLPYYNFESRIKHKDGNWVWVLDRGKVITWTDKGKPLMMFGTHQDITERKLDEDKIKSLLEEKELILKEVHHRIKNNMHTLIGILSLHADSLDDPQCKAALEDAGSRIGSMMVLYDKLYQSDNFNDIHVKEYLPSLVREVINNFPNSSIINFDIDVDDIILDVKIIQTLGIIINELLTNIMKYAFTGKGSGLIKITLKKDGKEITLNIQDNGNGLPDGFDIDNTKGFGLRLINMLIHQLDEKFTIENYNGTRSILNFSL
jgi:PAS domain S-box-containing protein